MTEQQGQAPAADTTPTTEQAAPADAVHAVEVTTAPAEPQQASEDTTAPKPAAPAPAPEVKPEAAKPAAPDADDLASLSPAELAKMVRKLRAENASDRTNAKQQAAADAESALVQKLGKAFGFVKDDAEAAPPTAEELTAQLTAAQKAAADRDTELRALRVETAAAKAARKAGADVDSLLDSRTFAAKLGELDPSDDGFTAALDALVAKTVEDNPKYKATSPAPAASSGDFSGGSGDKPPTRNDFDDFRRARRARSGLD
ncbi:hypothetical protein ABZ234_03715 [Nocardiopsis sp. NPDC006198]|uniref:hypothetical protein n=1 Tax=Nocardiopsis sp. NPDC006198 TaxID=3154472 RepID=UPI0033A08548